MKVSDYFEKELNYISNRHLRNIVINTLNVSPDCIVHIPASSSGKYHPAYSLGEGGLMRHIKAAIGIARSMIEIDIFKNFIFGAETETSLEEITKYADIAYAALILHDCCKPDGTPEHRTQFEHPEYASALFVNNALLYKRDDEISAEESDSLIATILLTSSSIASHMGQWNTSPYAKGVVLQKPIKPIEQFVHMCDYLASRKFLEFDFEVYNEEMD